MDNICPTICVGSMGEVGSWVLSCATRSWRNKSLELLASESEVGLLLSVELLEPVCDVLDVWSKGIAMWIDHHSCFSFTLFLTAICDC